MVAAAAMVVSEGRPQGGEVGPIGEGSLFGRAVVAMPHLLHEGLWLAGMSAMGWFQIGTYRHLGLPDSAATKVKPIAAVLAPLAFTACRVKEEGAVARWLFGPDEGAPDLSRLSD